MKLSVFLLAILIPACASSSLAFHLMLSAYKLNKKVTIYSLDVLLFLFGTSLLFHVQFCCFMTCIQISQEAGQVVWYCHLFQNFQQFLVIHIVKGFGIVNKAEIDVFLELSCFYDDSSDVGSLILNTINSLICADDTILMAESEEELKSLLIKLKEE